jgi:hypothetical protein
MWALNSVIDPIGRQVIKTDKSGEWFSWVRLQCGRQPA